jgi:hypothetical protein
MLMAVVNNPLVFLRSYRRYPDFQLSSGIPGGKEIVDLSTGHIHPADWFVT